MSSNVTNGLLSLANPVRGQQQVRSGLGLASALRMGPPAIPGGGLGLLAQALVNPQETTVRGAAMSAAKADEAPKWIFVIDRFTTFLETLKLTSAQVDDGETKYKGVVACLNAAYYGHNSESANAFLIGSWAKKTRIRPPRDVDIYFVLPPEVYHRFQAYSLGVNKQSALLQEVKSKLLAKYGSSAIKGDGPVVFAGFVTYDIEIVPAFALTEERTYWVCDTKGGGRYMTTKPLHEVDAIDAADTRNNGNVRSLVRMLKAWQANCTVPIRSFYLELLAIEFLDQWRWNQQSYFFYDWMCRDFFAWLTTKASSFVMAPGTFEVMWLGDDWKSKAESAYSRAVKACDFEQKNEMISAGDEWQKIFGVSVPRSI